MNLIVHIIPEISAGGRPNMPKFIIGETVPRRATFRGLALSRQSCDQAYRKKLPGNIQSHIRPPSASPKLLIFRKFEHDTKFKAKNSENLKN